MLPCGGSVSSYPLSALAFACVHIDLEKLIPIGQRGGIGWRSYFGVTEATLPGFFYQVYVFARFVIIIAIEAEILVSVRGG